MGRSRSVCNPSKCTFRLPSPPRPSDRPSIIMNKISENCFGKLRNLICQNVSKNLLVFFLNLISFKSSSEKWTSRHTSLQNQNSIKDVGLNPSHQKTNSDLAKILSAVKPELRTISEQQLPACNGHNFKLVLHE